MRISLFDAENRLIKEAHCKRGSFQMLIEMRLVGLAMDPFNNSPIMILKDKASADAERAAAQSAAREEKPTPAQNKATKQKSEASESEETAPKSEAFAHATQAANKASEHFRRGSDLMTDQMTEATASQAAQTELSDATAQTELSDAAAQTELSDAAVQVEEDGAQEGHLLPIWIGEAEANAIATELLGIVSVRPMTHDLMKQLIVALGGAASSGGCDGSARQYILRGHRDQDGAR